MAGLVVVFLDNVSTSFPLLLPVSSPVEIRNKGNKEINSDGIFSRVQTLLNAILYPDKKPASRETFAVDKHSVLYIRDALISTVAAQ